MKFTTYLKRQKHRDDIVGDLAQDFISSGDPSPGNTKEDWVKYLEVYGQHVLDALDEAYSEFISQ